MAKVGAAIARYHKLLHEKAYGDLAWAHQFDERVRQHSVTPSGRLSTLALRPYLISTRDLSRLATASERLAAILDQIQTLALQTPSLLERLRLLPAEKMLAAVPPGYPLACVNSQLQASLHAGSLCVYGFEPSNASALLCSDRLADLSLELPILKDFKRGLYKLSKITDSKHVLAAVLRAWKQFGGRRKPCIAVVEFKDHLGSDSGEGSALLELLNENGASARLASPEELEYRGGRLRAADFEIDVVFRRVRTRELLLRFDLSHPLLAAYRDRTVCVVNSFRSEIAERRALFDLLTDETVTERLPPADQKYIRDLVPWTRIVAPRKTARCGKEIDLPEFIHRNREQLVLRPNDPADGHPVFIGAALDQTAWEHAAKLALRTPYVVQDCVASDSQMFPILQGGELQMKQVDVSVHPFLFNGKMHGASALLRPTSHSTANPPTPVPILLLEDR